MESAETKTGKDRKNRSSVFNERPEYERLGKWLRLQREKKGLLQKPLSRALGKPAEFLHKVEGGRQRLDLVEFRDLARLLELDPKLTLEDLFAGIEAPRRP